MSYCKQRVFSHKDSYNYIDYLKIKNGEIILKNHKMNNPNITLNRFISYQDFLNITKAYYKYKNNHICNLHLLTDMYNTNSSFITYQKILEHVDNCDYCSTYNSHFPLADIKCNKLLNILYPYGVYQNINESNIYYPSNMNLNEWCNKEKKNCDQSEQYIDTNIQTNYNIQYEDTYYENYENYENHEDDTIKPDDDYVPKYEIIKKTINKKDSSTQVDSDVIRPNVIRPNVIKQDVIKPNIIKQEVIKPNVIKQEVIKPKKTNTSTFGNNYTMIKKNAPLNKDFSTQVDSITNTTKKHYSNSCGSKYGLCKNTKPLFI